MLSFSPRKVSSTQTWCIRCWIGPVVIQYFRLLGEELTYFLIGLGALHGIGGDYTFLSYWTVTCISPSFFSGGRRFHGDASETLTYSTLYQSGEYRSNFSMAYNGNTDGIFHSFTRDLIWEANACQWHLVQSGFLLIIIIVSDWYTTLAIGYGLWWVRDNFTE